MTLFSMIVLGLAGVLLAGSGLCGALFLALGDADWRRLALKLFRISMVLVLLWVNVALYAHIVASVF